MNNAPLVALGDIVEIKGGGTPSKANAAFWGGDIPWVSPKDMKRWEIADAEDKITVEAIKGSATNLIPENAILIVNRSGILKHTLPVGITRRPVAINQDIKALICNSHADPVYIAHIVKASEPVILKWVRATTADNFSIDNLRDLSIPLPPLDEQRRIAAILDKADALRRKRREAIVLLDSLTQSIFLEMFGDPISNTYGWHSETLGTLGVQMTYGPRFYNEAYSDDGIRIVRITDLADNGTLDFKAMPRLAMPENEVLVHRSRPGEILFARTGATVGKMALVAADDPPTIPGAYFIRMRFPDNIVPLFAWFTLRCNSIQKIIFEGSRQSAQQNFSGPGLRRLPMIVPPKRVQLAFCDRVERIRKLRPLNSKMSGNVDCLVSSLQSRAFSGRL